MNEKGKLQKKNFKRNTKFSKLELIKEGEKVGGGGGGGGGVHCFSGSQEI